MNKNSAIYIPEEAVKYILLQRTELHSFPTRVLCAALNKLKLPHAGRLLAFEEKFRRGEIVKRFLDGMNREYLSIKDHLPEKAQKVMDVGCGISAIDAFIFNHYGSAGIDFFLLDKTEVADKIFYGFKHKAAFYNSMEIAGETLSRNGVPGENIHLLDVADGPPESVGNVDLLISLISWGFHYPVETYLDYAFENLSPGGRLILDIRKGTGGKRLLEEKFGNLEIIHEEEKRYRVLAVKN